MSDTTYYTPQVVLAVGAHADDIDVIAGGTLARWVKEGAEVYYLVLTNSCCGSSDKNMTHQELAQIRSDEQRAAAQAIGAKDVFILDNQDGSLEVTQAVKTDIVRVIRQIKPDTVVTFDPSFLYSVDRGMINHTDHRATGQATLDAVFPLARDHLTFPALWQDEKLEPHKVQHVLLSNLDEQNFFVDISEHFETKIQAVTAHASQFADSEMMREHLAQQAEALAAKTGSRYAEGFIRLDLAY